MDASSTLMLPAGQKVGVKAFHISMKLRKLSIHPLVDLLATLATCYRVPLMSLLRSLSLYDP